MTQRWQKYWAEHAAQSSQEHPQIQVLRTLDRQPIAPELFEDIVEGALDKLELNDGDTVLDLCCGRHRDVTITDQRASNSNPRRRCDLLMNI